MSVKKRPKQYANRAPSACFLRLAAAAAAVPGWWGRRCRSLFLFIWMIPASGVVAPPSRLLGDLGVPCQQPSDFTTPEGETVFELGDSELSSELDEIEYLYLTEQIEAPKTVEYREVQG